MTKVLFVADLRDDWGLFMPALLAAARERGASILVLETAATIGSGNFTVAPVQNEPGPTEPVDPNLPAVNPLERQASPDIHVAANQAQAFVNNLVAYIREAGLEAEGDWQPDFNREHLDVYARNAGAGVIAIPHRHAVAGWLQDRYVNRLRDAGLEVLLLEEAKAADLPAGLRP
ncbi:MAG TPA: hypothetical protein VHN99_09545 [Deinococcales bacterium]|nr:hypothetical protein [Deinococcales bacterium]